MSEGPIRITQPLLAVLDALLDAGHELHGWAIIKTTGRSGPTVYKILERLTEAGWLASRWGEETEPGRPRRRYYELTGQGRLNAQKIIAQRSRAAKPARLRPAFCGGAA